MGVSVVVQTSAFQADDASSILATRSSILIRFIFNAAEILVFW